MPGCPDQIVPKGRERREREAAAAAAADAGGSFKSIGHWEEVHIRPTARKAVRKVVVVGVMNGLAAHKTAAEDSGCWGGIANGRNGLPIS